MLGKEVDERSERDASAAFRELGSSGSSESFKLADEGGMDLAGPDNDGELGEFAKGDGAGMGPVVKFREELIGAKLLELGKDCGVTSGNVANPEFGNVDGPPLGNPGCAIVVDGNSGNEDSDGIAASPSPDMGKLGAEPSPLGRDGGGTGGRLPVSGATDLMDGMAGEAACKLLASSFRKGLLLDDRDVELAEGNGRYWSGGGSARDPARF